jgi:hypothetical protein
MDIKMSNLGIVVHTYNTSTQENSLRYLVRTFMPTIDRMRKHIGKQFHLQ